MDERQEWDYFWQQHRNQRTVSRVINHFRLEYNEHFKKILRKKITPKTQIAELGCGSSSLMLLLHKEVKGITCVDFSREALKLSKQNAKAAGATNITFLEDDCRHLKKLSGPAFDLVWSQGLLEHFSNPEKVLEQHIKICKPKGTVVVSVPARYSFSYLWYLASKIPLLRKIWPWTEKQDFYTPKDLEKMIKKLGYGFSAGVRIYMLKPFILGILIMEIEKGRLEKKNS